MVEQGNTSSAVHCFVTWFFVTKKEIKNYFRNGALGARGWRSLVVTQHCACDWLILPLGNWWIMWPLDIVVIAPTTANIWQQATAKSHSLAELTQSVIWREKKKAPPKNHHWKKKKKNTWISWSKFFIIKLFFFFSYLLSSIRFPPRLWSL